MSAELYLVTFWSGADIKRGVRGIVRALTLAQEAARAKGRTTAVYPIVEGGLGQRVARCDPDGTMETYGPDHWAREMPATMGQKRAAPDSTCLITEYGLTQRLSFQIKVF